jgi:small subunit ribosomal protein S11
MGKKRIIKKNTSGVDSSLKARSLSKALKRKLTEGILYVESTYNNTRVTLTDKEGNTLTWSSSGALGFKGAKKGTPFAASKIGELIGEKASQSGIKEVSVIVKVLDLDVNQLLEVLLHSILTLLLSKIVLLYHIMVQKLRDHVTFNY